MCAPAQPVRHGDARGRALAARGTTRAGTTDAKYGGMNPQAHTPSRAAATLGPAPREHLRVLVVSGRPGAERQPPAGLADLGHSVAFEASHAEGLASCERELFDVVLFDAGSEAEVRTFCGRVREACPANCYVYILAATPTLTPEREISALQAGADAVLAEPIDPALLAAKLGAARRVTAAQRKLRVANRSLRRQSERALLAAMKDPLTQTPNRRQLHADIAALAAADDGAPAALAVFDVDRFKSYNDAHGHVEGDRILAEIARVAQSTLRRVDALYRYGGDEFIVLLRDSDIASASAAMHRLATAVRRLVIPDRRHARGTVTVSVGIAAGPLQTPEEWIARADAAMYQAKQAGRDRVDVA